MVAPDRTRRAWHRPQRGEPAPAPADGEGAELPRRRASCRARAFLDVALDRARPPCEEARAGGLPRLRARRTRVGACWTRAARAPSSRGGEGRAARRGLCEEGQRPAHRGRQAPALNTLAGRAARRVGFENPVMRREGLSCGCFVFVDEAAEQFVFANVSGRSASGRCWAFLKRLQRERSVRPSGTWTVQQALWGAKTRFRLQIR